MFRSVYKDATPWGRFWLTVGLVSLAAASAMSFDFGWGVSAKHAVFLACLSVVTAFLPHAAHHTWESGKRGAAMALAVASIPLFAIEFFSHAGYTAGLRGLNISETQVQNVKYDDARKDVDDQIAMLKMFEQRLADLQGDNKWTISVTADALRARLSGLNLAIDQEAARGGCKTKCLERTKERDDVASKIAVLERVDDTTAKIEATKRVIASYRDKSAKTEHKSSAVEHQNAFLTKAVSLTVSGKLEASPVLQEQVQQAVNSGMALAGTGLPALAFFAYGLYAIRRKDEDHGSPARAHVARETSQPITMNVTPNSNRELYDMVVKALGPQKAAA